MSALFTVASRLITLFIYVIIGYVISSRKIVSREFTDGISRFLMTVILPVLLALLYYGFFLHDKGVLNGAAQQITAQADLNQWKKTGNNRLGKQAKALEKMTGPSKDVSSSVSVTEKQAKVQYQGTISLPGLLPSLFGKSKLSTGADADRLLLHPADLIRKIRGLEYASALLKGKHA
jgi:hypothetical protein